MIEVELDQPAVVLQVPMPVPDAEDRRALRINERFRIIGRWELPQRPATSLLKDLEFSVDWGRVGQDVPDRRRILNVLAEALQLLAGGVLRPHAAANPDRSEAGAPAAEAEEAVKVDITLDLVRDLLELDSLGRCVRHVSNCVAKAKSSQAELHRIGTEVAAQENGGLIALDLEPTRQPGRILCTSMCERANTRHGVGAFQPFDPRPESHLGLRGILLDCADRRYQLIDVDPVSNCHCSHRANLLGDGRRLRPMPFKTVTSSQYIASGG